MTHYLDILSDSKFSSFEDGSKLRKWLYILEACLGIREIKMSTCISNQSKSNFKVVQLMSLCVVSIASCICVILGRMSALECKTLLAILEIEY